MTPQLLLQHFHRIGEAPDAIPRLRRFILDLAVRGKLVEQDPRDEPASDLVKRIQIEKAHLLGSGEGRKEKPTAPLADEDLPFRVPNNWSWSQLAKVGIINPRNTAEDVLPASFVPMPLISADYRVANKHEIRPWADIKSGYTHFAEGDVALAKITPCFENGKSTIFRSLTGGIGAGTTELHVVRPVIISADYVLIFLKCPHFIESGIPKMTGTAGQKRVSKEYFAYSPFPLPPLAEQHRIVAKVDELMALCDRLEAAQTEREGRRDRLVASSLHHLNSGANADAFREHARFYFNHLPRLTTRPDHIKQLRQTILNLAVRGKLVEQDPTDEPAFELRNQIHAEKVRLLKEGAIKRTQLVLPIEAAEISSTIPNRWEWVRLGDVLFGDSQNGYSKKPDDAPNGIPILRISAATVRRDGIVAEEEHKLVSSVSLTQQKHYNLQPGDLLACRFNGNRNSVGRLALYLGYLGIKPIYPDKLIRLRLLSKFVVPKLVRCFAESTIVRRDIESFCATTVGNWGISASNLKRVRIPLPPLAEQHRIVAKVDELMALCDQLETQLTTTQTENKKLMESIFQVLLAA